MMDMKHWIRFRASALAVACAVVFSTAAMAAPKIYAPGTQGLPSSKTSKIEINQRDGMRVLSIVGEATPGIACTPLVNLQGQLFQKNGEKQEYILCPGKYRVSVYHLERINMIREYRLFGSNGQWSTNPPANPCNGRRIDQTSMSCFQRIEVRVREVSAPGWNGELATDVIPGRTYIYKYGKIVIK